MATTKERIQQIRARRITGLEYYGTGQGENMGREQAVKCLKSYKKMKKRGTQKYLTPAGKTSANLRILLALQRISINGSGNLFLEYPTPIAQDNFWGLKKLPLGGYRIKK